MYVRKAMWSVVFVCLTVKQPLYVKVTGSWPRLLNEPEFLANACLGLSQFLGHRSLQIAYVLPLFSLITVI